MGFFRKKSADTDFADFDTAIRALLSKYAPAGVRVEEGDNDSLLTGDHRTNLGNLRQRWSELEETDRLPWLESAVSDMLSGANEIAELDLTRLRPGVRSRATLSNGMLHFAVEHGGFDSMFEIPSRPIARDLGWILIWDTPHTMGMINNARLDDWGRGFDALFEVAVSNLMTGPIESWGVAEDRVFAPVVDDDDYLGSFVFGPNGLDALPFEDERVVFHPTRSCCFIASASDPEGIALAAQLTADVAGSANPISLAPVVGRAGDWRPLQLHHTHPAHSLVRQLEVMDLLDGYGSQQGLLQELMGEDLFVTTCKAIQRDDGSPVTIAAWTDGVPALLPRAEVIAFTGDNVSDELFFVGWEDVQRICGHRLEPTTHHPARWRVLEYPDTAELEALRDTQTDLA